MIVVSALGRSKDSRGRNSYEGKDLNLASFRESSELEFGCDDAYILTQKPKSDDDEVTLMHLKSRYGQAKDISLTFDRPCQRFTSHEHHSNEVEGIDSKKRVAELRALWKKTPPAVEETGDDNHDK